MSPVDINVPTRSALVPKTKDFFVSLLTNLKYNKNNVFTGMQLVMSPISAASEKVCTVISKIH